MRRALREQSTQQKTDSIEGSMRTRPGQMLQGQMVRHRIGFRTPGRNEPRTGSATARPASCTPWPDPCEHRTQGSEPRVDTLRLVRAQTGEQHSRGSTRGTPNAERSVNRKAALPHRTFRKHDERDGAEAQAHKANEKGAEVRTRRSRRCRGASCTRRQTCPQSQECKDEP